MRIFSIFTLLVCLIIPSHANAARSVFKNEYISAKLKMINQGGKIPISGALEVTLAPGWHTYWRIPGDSGLPPKFSWAESENIKDVEISWPVPKRKKEYEFYTFAYERNMTLPLSITLDDKTKEAKLSLKAQIMICKDICIPQKFELATPFKLTNDVEKMKLHYALFPAKRELKSLKINSIVAGKKQLIVNVMSDDGFEGLDVFPVIEEELLGLALPPQIEISEHDQAQAMVRISAPGDIKNLARYLNGKTLSVTLVHDDEAVEKSIQY